MTPLARPTAGGRHEAVAIIRLTALTVQWNPRTFQAVAA